MAIVYCPKCGKELKELHDYCPHCGNLISNRETMIEHHDNIGNYRSIKTIITIASIFAILAIISYLIFTIFYYTWDCVYTVFDYNGFSYMTNLANETIAVLLFLVISLFAIINIIVKRRYIVIIQTILFLALGILSFNTSNILSSMPSYSHIGLGAMLGGFLFLLAAILYFIAFILYPKVANTDSNKKQIEIHSKRHVLSIIGTGFIALIWVAGSGIHLYSVVLIF